MSDALKRVVRKAQHTNILSAEEISVLTDGVAVLRQRVAEQDDEIERLRGELAIIEKPTGILELERQLEDATSELDDAQTRIAALEKVVEAARYAQTLADNEEIPIQVVTAATLDIRKALHDLDEQGG